MGKYLLKLPKMGESVAEATLISWLKEVGDSVSADESIVEIATDKVDSDVPSEFSGKLIEKRFNVDDIIKVGEVIAVIESNDVLDNDISELDEITESSSSEHDDPNLASNIESHEVHEASKLIETAKKLISSDENEVNRFYSPLVKNIAKKENISETELSTII